MCITKTKKCLVHLTRKYIIYVFTSIQERVCTGAPVNMERLWSGDRVEGGWWRGRNPGKKQKKKGSEWAWWESYSPGAGTFWFKAVNQTQPPPSSKHTHTLLFFSVQVQMHLEESKQPQTVQNPKCISVCVHFRERREGKERTQMFPCPRLPLSFSLCSPGGVSEGRGRVHSVVTSTRCAPLTQIT